MNLEETVESARPFLDRIVKEAASILMKHFRSPLKMSNKVGNDIVTQADLESEAHVAGAIRAQFPTHALIAEEGSVGAAESEFCWHIDPLDGTVNFAAGTPIFAVAVSLSHRNRPVLSAILDPTRDEFYFAQEGRGATCNGTPIRVSETATLSQSLVYVSTFALRRPDQVDRVTSALRRLGVETRNVVNLGSAGISWAYVAAGRLDGEVSFSADQYTGPAGILLVRGAGGRATDFSGADWIPGGVDLVASNGKIHDELLAAVE